VETIQSDRATGLPDASVDVVLLYDIFHLLDDPDGVLRELYRVLKPNGTLSISDHHMKEDGIVSGVTSGGLFELTNKGKKTYGFAKGRKSLTRDTARAVQDVLPPMGTVKKKVDPLRGIDSTHTSPPHPSTARFTVERPIPSPW